VTALIAQPKFLNGFVDGADLVLLYRDAAGQMLSRRRKAEWSSFYRREAVTPEVMRDLRNSSFVVGVSEEPATKPEWVRVRWQAPEWRRKAHEPDGWAEKQGLTAFEADVSEVRRFFAETGAEVATPRRCYVDIETDSRVPPAVARKGKARVLCWSIAVDDTPEKDARDPSGLRVAASAVLEEDTDAAEVKLLEAFWRAVDGYDQLVAWYGDGFDFPILRLRTSLLGANAKDPRRWLYVDQLVAHERMNRNAAESGAEKESMALDFVARELGVGQKVEFDASKTYEVWASGPEGKARLLHYCEHDTLLLPGIERKTGYLALNATLCEISQCFQETRNFFPIPLVDGVLLRMGVERCLRFPSVRMQEGPHEKFAGAFVLEPQATGIRKNVHVFDFARMYPSIMISWNMSPETRAPIPVNGPIPPGHARAPTTRTGFVHGPIGIVPEALKRILDKRKFWQKKQASLPPGTPEWNDAGRRSNAYKVMANIFYGACGSPFCRFFDRAVAESTSTTGSWLIQKTLAAAEERGMFSLYSDTDSGFVERATREEVAAFVEWCNAELYPALVRECGCVENYVDLAYEKEFERLIMTSKKHYCSVFRHYKWSTPCTCTKENGDPGSVDVRAMKCRDCGKTWEELPPLRGKPEIKGLEYKRGDAIKLARQLQYQVVERLCSEQCEDPAEFIPLLDAMRKHVLEDALPVEEVRQSQAITRSLKEYKTKEKLDGTQTADLPHVQVAKILKARGELIEEGVKIFYYVTDASVSPMKVAPAVDYAGEPDRFYLWESKIYPATQRVLEAAFPTEKGMTLEALQLRDWRRFEKVRPKKARARKELEPPERVPGPAGAGKGRARRAPASQGGLFETVATPVPSAQSPAGGPILSKDEPFVVEVEADRDTQEGAKLLLRVKDALRQHPGDRAVELRITTPGGTAILDVPMRVALSADLVRDVERAKGAA
jgi:DNA polymerase elongation subunit (family B)